MGFSGETLFKEISFSVDEKDKIGIIGVNGAGKTTLIKLLLGLENSEINPATNERGTISKKSNLKVGYLAQNTQLNKENTVFNELMTVFNNLLEDYNRMQEINFLLTVDLDNFENLAKNYLNNYIRRLKLIKLSADRNLVPEVQNSNRIVSEDGTGATNLLRQYLNVANLPNEVVENDILNALNQIMKPENYFEIYLLWKSGKINGTNAAKKCGMPLTTFRYRAKILEQSEKYDHSVLTKKCTFADFSLGKGNGVGLFCVNYYNYNANTPLAPLKGGMLRRILHLNSSFYSINFAKV